FLNVVIHRLPLGESLVAPGSHCPNCQAPIRPWHNVPLVSWILLRGRCRDCHAPIAMRYPLVEAATALLFVGVVLASRSVVGLTLGLILGKAVGPAMLVALVVGVVVGAAIIARTGTRVGRKTAVPFGPMLGIGGLVGLYAGSTVVAWYLGTFA